MKKSSLLISAVAITTIAGIIFAQTGGAATVLTMVEKMKAASHDFTLTTELNQGQTDLKSGPLSGKKTGGIVTAEEYNRILEMLSEESEGTVETSGWEDVSLTDTADFDTACMYRVNTIAFSYPTSGPGTTNQYNYATRVDTTFLTFPIAQYEWNDTTNQTTYLYLYHTGRISSTSKNTWVTVADIDGIVGSSRTVTKLQKLCGGGGGGGGGASSGCTTWIQAPKTLGVEPTPTPYGLCRFTASGAGSPEDTYYGNVFQNNHAGSSENSGDVWSCEVAGAAGPRYQTWMNQNGLGSTFSGIRLTSTKNYGFEYCIGGGGGGTGGVNSGTSMVPGWPDAIVCTASDEKDVIFYNSGENANASEVIYFTRFSSAPGWFMRFNPDKSFKSGESKFDCNGKSIQQLIDSGKTFNFVGGGGASTGGGSGASNTCRWVNAPGGCVTGATLEETSCADDEYVKKVRTHQVCHIAQSTYKTKTDLFCCKFAQ